MRKRMMQVGAIGLIGLGIWLASLFWKGPGLGGAGTDFSPNPSVRVDASPTSQTTSTQRPSEPQAAAGAEFVTIVIHGDQFRLAPADDLQSGLDLPLEEIVSKAAGVKGNAHGVRVRIVKSRTAQEGARSDLLSALAEGGVKREEIQERAEFID